MKEYKRKFSSLTISIRQLKQEIAEKDISTAIRPLDHRPAVAHCRCYRFHHRAHFAGARQERHCRPEVPERRCSASYQGPGCGHQVPGTLSGASPPDARAWAWAWAQ